MKLIQKTCIGALHMALISSTLLAAPNNNTDWAGSSSTEQLFYKQGLLEGTLSKLDDSVKDGFNRVNHDLDEFKGMTNQRLEKVEDRLTSIESLLRDIVYELKEIRSDNKALRQSVGLLEDKSNRHNATILTLQSDVEALKQHWTFQLSERFFYNPLTYVAMGTAAMGVHFEGVDQDMTRRVLACYVSAVLLTDQLAWNLFEPAIPAGLTNVAEILLFAAAGVGINHIHAHQRVLNPYITWSSVLTFSAFGAAVTQYKNIVSLFPSWR